MAKRAASSIDQLVEEFGVLISDPTDTEVIEPTNAVIYGLPGSGKTGLACTAPLPLVLDFERGATSTARAIAKLYGVEIKVVKISEISQVHDVYRLLQSGKHGFKTVVLDPVGEMQKMIMADIVDRYPQRRIYDDQPLMQDWGKAGSEAIGIITKFRALPMHTVVVAHAQTPTGDGAEDKPIMPLVQGKQFGPYLMGAMDLLAYAYTEVSKKGEAPQRLLLTQSNGRVVAKNRGNKLPVVVAEPNLSEIFDAMESLED